MSVIADRPRGYYYRGDAVEIPENLDTLHEVALMLNQIESRHIEDVTVLAGCLKAYANRYGHNKMCEEFEKTVKLWSANLFRGDLFWANVNRYKKITVAVVFEIDSLTNEGGQEYVVDEYLTSNGYNCATSITSEEEEEANTEECYPCSRGECDDHQ